MCFFAVAFATNTKIPRECDNGDYPFEKVMGALEKEMELELGTKFKYNMDLTAAAYAHLIKRVERDHVAATLKSKFEYSELKFHFVTVQDSDGGPYIEHAISKPTEGFGHPIDGTFNEFGCAWQDASVAGWKPQLMFCFIYGRRTGPAPQTLKAPKAAAANSRSPTPSPARSDRSASTGSLAASDRSVGNNHSTIGPLPVRPIKLPRANSNFEKRNGALDTPVSDLYDRRTIRQQFR